MFNRKKKCKHDWATGQMFMITTQDGKEFPRLWFVCKKCGVAVHKPVYNFSVLKQKEKEDDDDEEE